MKFDFVWTRAVWCFELSHFGQSCHFVLISDRPFSCQRQTALNTDLHSMQITAEKLTRCDDREVKFELIILFRPGTIEFSSSAVDVWALSHWRFCCYIDLSLRSCPLSISPLYLSREEGVIFFPLASSALEKKRKKKRLIAGYIDLSHALSNTTSPLAVT